MAKVFSWKIDTYKYAYLYIPGKPNVHVCDRITDENTIQKMVAEVSQWSYSEAQAAFNEAAVEAEFYGKTMVWNSDYWSDDDITTNVVILTGKDGENGLNGQSGKDGTGGSGGYNPGNDSDIAKECKDFIDKELAKIRELLKNESDKVWEKIEDDTNGELSEARRQLQEAQTNLQNIKAQLEADLIDAKEALRRAKEALENGTLDPDEILLEIGSFKNWLIDNSGYVETMKTDYDVARNIIGGIAVSEDVPRGALSLIATSLNITNGTVGTIKDEVDASTASINQFASWQDTIIEEAAEVQSRLSAAEASIRDSVSYTRDEIAVIAWDEINGKKGQLTQGIQAEIEGAINAIEQTMDGFSASVSTKISRRDGEGNIVYIKDDLDAMNQTIERSLLVSNSAMSATTRLSDSWSAEDGMLRSVSKMVAQCDSEGNVMYYYSGSGEEQRVYLNDEDGKFHYGLNDGGNLGGLVENQALVYVHFADSHLGSFIKQTASAITMEVVGEDGNIAAIIEGITEDGSFINLIADNVTVDADMIAKALSANSANIDGILIGNKQIKTTGTTPSFVLDGRTGKLSATNAEIKGKIVADEGKIGGFVISDSSLEMRDSDDSDKVKAILNGSDSIKNESDNSLIMAAGIDNGSTANITYYAWKITGVSSITIDNGIVNPFSCDTIYTTDDYFEKKAQINTRITVFTQKDETDENHPDVKYESNDFYLSDIIPSSSNTINGIVIDAMTHLPIEGAKIFPLQNDTNFATVYTDSDGKFELDSAATITNVRRIIVSKDGYADYEVTITSYETLSIQLVKADISSDVEDGGDGYWDNTGGVNGVVRDAKNFAGLPGATVSIDGTSISTFTGDIGYFSFSCGTAIQNDVLKISLNGYKDKYVRVTQTSLGYISLESDNPSLSSVTITVTANWGEIGPIKDAVVKINNVSVGTTSLDGRLSYTIGNNPTIDELIFGVGERNLDGMDITVIHSDYGTHRSKIHDGNVNVRMFPKPNAMRVIRINEMECSECGACISACRTQALTSRGQYPVFNRDKCLFCSSCINACPSGAITMEYGNVVRSPNPMDDEILGAPSPTRYGNIEYVQKVVDIDFSLDGASTYRGSNTIEDIDRKTAFVDLNDSDFDLDDGDDIEIINYSPITTIKCPNCGEIHTTNTLPKRCSCGTMVGNFTQLNNSEDVSPSAKTYSDTREIKSIYHKTTEGVKIYFVRDEDSDVSTDKIDFNKSATRIYDDGSLYTKHLFAEDGEFRGAIYAGGEFTGKLNNVGGVLRGAKIEDSSFDGSIKMGGGSSFIMNNNYNVPMFVINNEKVVDGHRNVEYRIPNHYESETNYKNKKQTWGPGKGGIELVSIRFEKGATISIPQFNISVTISDPKDNHSSPTPKYGLKSTVCYDDGYIQDVILLAYGIQSNEVGSHTETRRIAKQEITNNRNYGGVITFFWQYSITLRDRSLSKHAKFDESIIATGPILVKYETHPSQLSCSTFGPNGFVISQSGTSISMIDGKISLKCGNYELQIDDTGIRGVGPNGITSIIS